MDTNDPSIAGAGRLAGGAGGVVFELFEPQHEEDAAFSVITISTGQPTDEDVAKPGWTVPGGRRFARAHLEASAAFPTGRSKRRTGGWTNSRDMRCRRYSSIAEPPPLRAWSS
jgi:hypothetical protein